MTDDYTQIAIHILAKGDTQEWMDAAQRCLDGDSEDLMYLLEQEDLMDEYLNEANRYEMHTGKDFIDPAIWLENRDA